jgi:hypothetical protein
MSLSPQRDISSFASELQRREPHRGRQGASHREGENDDDAHADELIRRDLIAFSERREMLELAIKVLGLSRAEEQKLKVHLTLEQILGQSWSRPPVVKK